jgi:hypothetical protein
LPDVGLLTMDERMNAPSTPSQRIISDIAASPLKKQERA